MAIEPNHGWFAHMAQECARFGWTYDKHRHLYGQDGAQLLELFTNVLPRFLYGQDEKAPIPEFTTGFFVEAERRPGAE